MQSDWDTHEEGQKCKDLLSDEDNGLEELLDEPDNSPCVHKVASTHHNIHVLLYELFNAI